jgi:signal transduction histidine kinase
MIDQLLDFTRARSGGGITIASHPCNLAELAAHAGGELELAHPDWHIQYEVRGDANGRWEAARILQVISNLIGNAGQHGTNSEPISVRVDGSAKSEVCLSVRNAGVIPESVRTYMFEPFLHNRRAQNSAAGGLGLGLFIVREIVRAHGGVVHVECSDAETVASVRLPRDRGTSNSGSTAVSHTARSPGT